MTRQPVPISSVSRAATAADLARPEKDAKGKRASRRWQQGQAENYDTTARPPHVRRKPLGRKYLPGEADCGKQKGCFAEAGHAGSHDLHPRPTPDKETGMGTILAAVPQGMMLAQHRREWLALVEVALADALANGEKRQAGIEVIWRLANAVAAHIKDYRKAVTQKATWKHFQAVVGKSRRTVAYALRWLQDHALLAVIATGQTAENAGTETNLTAVYALLRPIEQVINKSGDDDCTPTPSKVDIWYTHARETRLARKDALRATLLKAAKAASENDDLRSRLKNASHEAHSAPGKRLSKRKRLKNERLVLAAWLIEQDPDLGFTTDQHGNARPLSARYLAWEIKSMMGWFEHGQAQETVKAEKAAREIQQRQEQRDLENQNRIKWEAQLAGYAIEYPGLSVRQIALQKKHDAGEAHPANRCPRCAKTGQHANNPG